MKKIISKSYIFQKQKVGKLIIKIIDIPKYIPWYKSKCMNEQKT
jgi:hypothetical protein